MATNSTMKWFSHDLNAHDDLKIKKLLKKYGFSALGVYWFLVELLCIKGGRLEYNEAVDEIALVDGLSEDDVRKLLNQLIDFGLFFLEGSSIGSHRTDREIKENEDRHQSKVDAGRMGGLAKSSNAKANSSNAIADSSNALAKSSKLKQTLADSSTLHNITLHNNNNPPILPNGNNPPTGDAPTTKSRRFIKPTIQDIEEYGRQTGHIIDAQAFIDYYDSVDWKVGKHSMKDWQAAVRNWERRDISFSNKQEVNKGNSKIDCSGFTEDELAEIKRQEQEALELWRRDHATAN